MACMAEYIYVLEDGRIIKSGTRDELVRRGGKGVVLVEMQAQDYK
jgi:ABC-type multidrug transport system fused ATPase/permease subunit